MYQRGKPRTRTSQYACRGHNDHPDAAVTRMACNYRDDKDAARIRPKEGGVGWGREEGELNREG